MKHPTRTILFTFLALGSSNAAKAAERCSPHQSGSASVYAWSFHGKTTSSGKEFSQDGFTVAHPTLPFGTRVRINDEKTGLQVYATVTDRGPFSDHIVDMTVAMWGVLGHEVGERNSNESLGTTPVSMYRCRPT